MKFFTPDLIERFGSLDDAIADAANDEWEVAITRHQEQLQAIRPLLPPAFCFLWDNFYLHDADVLSMGRDGSDFVMVLRIEPPPRDTLILKYRLSHEPRINTQALPREHLTPKVYWLYDEVAHLPGNHLTFLHNILLSNCWEVELPFEDMDVLKAQTLIPELPVTSPGLTSQAPSL